MNIPACLLTDARKSLQWSALARSGLRRSAKHCSRMFRNLFDAVSLFYVPSPPLIKKFPYLAHISLISCCCETKPWSFKVTMAQSMKTIAKTLDLLLLQHEFAIKTHFFHGFLFFSFLKSGDGMNRLHGSFYYTTRPVAALLISFCCLICPSFSPYLFSSFFHANLLVNIEIFRKSMSEMANANEPKTGEMDVECGEKVTPDVVFSIDGDSEPVVVISSDH